MRRRPPRSTHTDTLVPYPTLVRAISKAIRKAAEGTTEARILMALLQSSTGRSTTATIAFSQQRQQDATRGAAALRFSWKCSYCGGDRRCKVRSEEHTSELQSLMRILYAVFCLKKKKTQESKL